MSTYRQQIAIASRKNTTDSWLFRRVKRMDNAQVEFDIAIAENELVYMTIADATESV